MDSANDLTQRLTDLEVKASFADDMLDQLNQTVFRQQQMIERLAREVAELKRRMPEGGAMPGTLRDELPPHY